MLEKGDKIGDYVLDKFLGRGQFGEVWLAEKHLQFSTRKVRHALKFLFNGGDEIDLKAAEAEMDTWIEASGHPNVMSVLDMLLYRDYIVIVSEYAEGGSLKGWLQKNGGKAPSPEKALEMMSGILRGIEHLHAKSVVHRDLKPDNILLQGNFPRITDFGISRIVSSGSMSTKAMGSPAYMSPESFNGNKSPQTDIWSAGVILYEMLTGEYPFNSEAIYGLVLAIQQEEMKPLPETVSPELREVIGHALEKDREKRTQTAREMRLAVERVLHKLKAGAEFVPPEKAVKPEEVTWKILDPPTREKLISPPTEAVNNAEATLPLPATSAKTLPSQTQPAEAERTFDKKIENTRDWHEVEGERIAREQAEIKSISQRLEQKTDGNQNNKILLAIGGAFLTVLLVGGLFWAMSGKSPTIANTAKSNSEIVSTNTSANNSNKQNIPTAPTGMVYVPGGEFMMGRDDGTSEAEKPAHKVSVNPFFMDIYEVTNEQYLEFVKAANHKTPTDWKNGNYPNGQAKFPVVGVDWNDANAFAKWAGKRLPIEEEWEFAARGTQNFLYPWGNDWKDGNANVGSQSFSEVGKFRGASPFGIYDMVGNAWEWTASDFKAYSKGDLSRLTNEEAPVDVNSLNSVNLPEDSFGLSDFASKSLIFFFTMLENSIFNKFNSMGIQFGFTLRQIIWDDTPRTTRKTPVPVRKPSVQSKIQTNEKTPQKAPSLLKTIRGGSFESTIDYATSTYRIGWASTGADNYSRVGFRCVQDVK
jgi:formylglycine-generating enzyme required for sulfatase activity